MTLMKLKNIKEKDNEVTELKEDGPKEQEQEEKQRKQIH